LTWMRACAADEVEPGDAIALEVDPPVAVFNVDGQFFATADLCSHGESSLADGYIDGGVVECSWHFAKFCIRTGDVLGPPAVVSIKTYAVRLEDGDVYVDV
jgi:nitrite reductase/ring-hydroxylating ferredoxin subunit